MKKMGFKTGVFEHQNQQWAPFLVSTGTDGQPILHPWILAYKSATKLSSRTITIAETLVSPGSNWTLVKTIFIWTWPGLDLMN